MCGGLSSTMVSSWHNKSHSPGTDIKPSEDWVRLPTCRGNWKWSRTQSSHPMLCTCTCTCTDVGVHTRWPSECSAEERYNKYTTTNYPRSQRTWFWYVRSWLSSSMPRLTSGNVFSDWKSRSMTLSVNTVSASHSRYSGELMLQGWRLAGGQKGHDVKKNNLHLYLHF